MIEMVFEVLRGGVTLCQSDQEGAGYPRGVLLGMQESGHRFQLDGKPWAPIKQRPTKREQPRRYITPGKRCSELDGAVQLSM